MTEGITDRFTLAEAVSMAEGEHFGLTEKGLDRLYDVFAHFADGGTIHDLEGFTSEEVVVWLGVAWNTSRYAVLDRG